jgi:glutaminase
MGDTNVKFSVQSTSKPISYAIALENHGPEKVHKHVGREPSGVSFNAITLNPSGLPHNPLINAGAIMVCSLIKQDMPESERFSYITDFWSRLAGGRSITFDNKIFLSERNTADTNHALAYLMKSRGSFPEGIHLGDVLEFYFQCCSLELDCDTMSVIAGTLANGGICPLSGERILSSGSVKEVLSIMNSCGMYDYSGEFAFRVGLPAKSGVSGAIMLIVPGLMGICTYAPPLDQYGNSAKGVQFCQEISKRFGFHCFEIDKKMASQVIKKDNTVINS